MVSRTESVLTSAAEMLYGLIMFVVTLAAVVVGVATYAYTAFRLWQHAHGRETAAVIVRLGFDFVDGFAALVQGTYELGNEVRQFVALPVDGQPAVH